MDVKLIPAFDDNYFFVVKAQNDSACFVVDPGAAAPVLDYLHTENLRLEAIFLTHHHADHTGGVHELLQKTACRLVVGPTYDLKRIPFINHACADGDEIEIFGMRATVFFTPGHTLGHVCYYFRDENALFCGDTLFSAGCGRLFEGTKEQMWASLNRLGTLPDDTLVYCAHEYTLSNLKFAEHVDPDNLDLKRYARSCAALRAKGTPTIPTSIGVERQINPFLRAKDADEFGKLRQHKDVFRA